LRDEHNERYPYYVPKYYRAFLKIRKLYRQGQVRLCERAAERKGPTGIVPDGEGTFREAKNGSLGNPKQDINKSFFWLDEDMDQPEIKAVADKINALKEDLQNKKLCFTTTAATFLTRMFYERSERVKLWENAWTIYHSGVNPNDRVLDIGGASTIFSFYLASMGCSVAAVDNDWGNCGTIYNSDYVAQKMGWDLRCYDRDIAKPLPFPDNHFDCVFSICVVEHLPSAVRRIMMREMGRVLKPSGVAGLTTDYDHRRKVLVTDKGLRFAYRNKLEEDVIKPSGLKIYGNADLVDAYPDQNFLGALFLRKKSN